MTTVDVLADIHEITKVKARYCRLIDTKRWDKLAGELTEDFVFDDEAKQLRLDCADAFLSFLRERHSYSISIHQAAMPEIDVSDDHTAVGTWAMSDFVQIPHTADITVQRGYGYYYDSFRKVDGQWLLGEVRLTRLWLSVGRETRLPHDLLGRTTAE